MNRPRLLFLCQNLPYPPDGGALIRSYHTLRILSQDFDVTALCFYRAATRASKEDVAHGIASLNELADVHGFPLPQDGSFIRKAWDHLRSLLTGRAYTRWTYESGALRRKLRDLTSRGTFDLVHVDSLDLVAYLPDLPTDITVCAHHNVESKLLQRRAAAESGLRRAYIRCQSYLTRNEERQWCGVVALNVVVSEEDGETLSEIAPNGRYLVVPNGVDTEKFRPPPENTHGEGIIFVGGSTWFPNLDGMEYFAEEILPRIRASRPDVAVTWVGRTNEQVRNRFSQQGIHVTGYVEDIVPWVHRAACFVVPLRVGGGTRLKILDAWALGAAVVSTSAGAEGLGAENGRQLLLADEPEAFAASVLEVLNSPSLRARLGLEGRRTATHAFDWKVIGAEMLRSYHRLSAQ